MTEAEQETKRILCNRCKEITHHHLRARYSRVVQVVHDDYGEPWTLGFPGPLDNIGDFAGSHYDEAEESPFQVRTSIWSCAGCDEETFEWQRLSTLSADPEKGEEWAEEDRAYYPERSGVPSIQRSEKYFHTLDTKLKKLYAEIITCFNHGSMLLCIIGLRSLLEAICKDKGLTDGNLEHKIDRLIKFLPSVNVIEALHSFRFAGNAAVHDLDPLSREDTEMAIGIVEDLLNFLYEIDYKASQVRVASNKGAAKSHRVH